MKTLKLLLKIGFSLALIAFIAHRFDWHSIAARFAEAGFTTLLTATAISLAIAPLHTLRWQTVLAANNTHLKFSALLRIVFIGYFFNQTLPSSVGGDALRIWCARRAGVSLGGALRSVLVDRGMTLVALLLMTAASLPWLYPLVTEPAARWAIVVVIVAGLSGFCAFLALKFVPLAWTRWRAVQALCSTAALARAVMSRPRLAIAAIAFSMLSFCGFALMIYTIAAGMHIAVSLRDCLLLMPLVILVTTVPISIAGWGLRESAMVAVFAFVQVPGSAAFAMSVLFGLALIVTSLPGAVIWWLGGYTLKKAAEENSEAQ